MQKNLEQQSEEHVLQLAYQKQPVMGQVCDSSITELNEDALFSIFNKFVRTGEQSKDSSEVWAGKLLFLDAQYSFQSF